jgi:hypothetical protein
MGCRPGNVLVPWSSKYGKISNVMAVGVTIWDVPSLMRLQLDIIGIQNKNIVF